MLLSIVLAPWFYPVSPHPFAQCWPHDHLVLPGLASSPAMPPVPSDDPIDLTVDPRDLLPRVVVDEWLPGERVSILFLFQFDRYPPCPSHYGISSNFESVLHQDTIQAFDYSSLLRVNPPALPSVSQAYQDAIRKSQHPVLSVTLKPHRHHPITLPAWIFDYWTEIGHAVGAQQRLKVALSWLKNYSILPSTEEQCYTLLLALSSFSWSRGAAYNSDTTPLFSESPKVSYLISYHIDCMAAQIRDEHEHSMGPTLHVTSSPLSTSSMLSSSVMAMRIQEKRVTIGKT